MTEEWRVIFARLPCILAKNEMQSSHVWKERKTLLIFNYLGYARHLKIDTASNYNLMVILKHRMLVVSILWI